MGGLIVQKYGGTSVANADLIKGVARRIARVHDSGTQVVAVVSAMGDTTDDLIALARQVAAEPSDREMALLWSTGEVVSSALTAMALHDLGYGATALTGFQAGIVTSAFHTKAHILEIDTARIRRELERGAIPIVAGFQGWTEDMDITVTGRGTSDTTAVALAVALQADRCEILKDVDGIFTADPRVVPGARKLDTISYEEIMELARAGSQVLHPRASELGEAYGMPIVVGSSFHEAPGTTIVRGEQMPLEGRQRVRAIAHETDVGRITIVGVPDRPGIAYAVFHPLEDAAINVDVIVQNVSHDNVTDISFTVGRADLTRALRLVQPVAEEMGAREVTSSGRLAKISVVGSGLAANPGYAARMFGTLAGAGINIVSITTSEIRITCLIDESQVAEAGRALHQAFLLEE
ncbi:MAG TPA: aspartate kinase [Chloroflexota bacterium]|nr:aspartate kinase [Chloroflexota bacterium]HEX2514670.1 aspartate kinase [Chloroflexota bacterium]